MTRLAFTEVGAADAPRTAFFLHGILGSGRNWRSFASRLTQRHPDWCLVLPDLRAHGDTPPLPPPHTLAACADDLARLADEVGAPELVVGHSFGGKVALACVEGRLGRGLRAAAVLDIAPGPLTGELPPDIALVLAAVKATPLPAPSRDALRASLRAQGLSDDLVAWLLTSARRGDDGWRWKYDLAAVDALLADYGRLDCWPLLAAPPVPITFVRAGQSDRWSPADLARFEDLPDVRLEVLPRAGHWLHVDDPEGLLDLLSPLFTPA